MDSSVRERKLNGLKSTFSSECEIAKGFILISYVDSLLWIFFIFSIDLKKLVINLDMDDRNWKIIEYENEKLGYRELLQHFTYMF
jgi:hypothetical protein